MTTNRELACVFCQGKGERTSADQLVAGVSTHIVLLGLGQFLGALHAERCRGIGHQSAVADLEITSTAKSVAFCLITVQCGLDSLELNRQTGTASLGHVLLGNGIDPAEASLGGLIELDRFARAIKRRRGDTNFHALVHEDGEKLVHTLKGHLLILDLGGSRAGKRHPKRALHLQPRKEDLDWIIH